VSNPAPGLQLRFRDQRRTAVLTVPCYPDSYLERSLTRIVRDFQHIKMHEGDNLIPSIAPLRAHNHYCTRWIRIRKHPIYIEPGHDGETEWPRTPEKGCLCFCGNLVSLYRLRTVQDCVYCCACNFLNGRATHISYGAMAYCTSP